MSNLVPAVTVLDKGLDLQTAKIIAAPGSVLDSLNYEQVDFQGQKRIEGYARYDGQHLPALDEYYRVLTADVSVVDGLVYSTDGDLFGSLLATDGLYTILAVIDYNLIAPLGAEAGTDYTATPELHYTNLLTYTEVLRGRVDPLPGPIIGLHWFRDRLYAVADVAYVLIQEDEATRLFPNDVVHTLAGAEAAVLDVFFLDSNYYVSLGAMDPDDWVEGTAVYNQDDVLVGTTVLSSYPGALPRYASFFESRSEQQAIDESATAGWTFVHLGWRVMFQNGEALYGDLAALNQNRTGVGVQGPTSIAGETGKPLVLQQAVTITDEPPQVNGWKSSTTPTLYALNPADVADIDSIFTYADAYITWDGTTGEVEAPGSDMTGLVEYPATNTVVVEV